MTDIAGDITTTEFLAPGSSLTSDIGFLGDVDWIETSLVATFAYGFEVTTTSSVLDLSLQLLDGTGSLITQTSAGNGAPATLSSVATASGSHYLAVFDSGGNDTGDYTLSINNDDNIAGSIATTTTTLTSAAPVVSAIDVNGDVDVLSVALTNGLSYGIDVSTTDADIDLALRLLDPLGGLLVQGFGANGGSAALTYSATETNTFYVSVADSSNNDTGDYTLTLNADDMILNSIATTEILAPGATLNSNIDVFGDVDFVSVSLTDGLSYGFDVDTTDAEMDLALRLFDPLGGLLVQGFGANGAPAALTYSATSTDTFYVSVADSSNNDTGDYALNFNADDTILNSIATTETLEGGATLNSNIDVFGDVDFVSVSLTEGLSYGYDVDTTDAEMDLALRLFDPVGGLLVQGFGANGAPAALTYSATSTDTFYVSVADSNNNDTGDYTLNFNADDTILNSIATTETLAGGSTLDSHVDVFGDVDFVGVSLTEGLSYGFDVDTTDADMDLALRLYDPTGGLLVQAFGADGSSAALTYSATSTNTFFVSVADSSGNDTGDYALSFNADDTILNSIATAETIAIGTCATSAIDVFGDVDVFGVDLVAGVTYEFTMSTNSDVMDSALRVLGPSGSLFLQGFGADGSTVTLSFTAATTETYFLSAADSSGNDIGDYMLLVTSGADDDLLGTGQGDELHGGAGNDTLSGQTGDDTLVGGSDDDVLRGSGGADSMLGGTGADVIFGGKDGDTIDGEAGNDEIDAGEDDDFAAGGEGDDLVKGAQGNDTLEGNAGNDTLRGGLAEDELYGGEGDDELSGSDGSDLLYGEDGDDLLLGDLQADTLYGGAGEDTLRGGGADDELYGEDDADLLFGSAGEDTLNGGAGNDTLEGGTQRDALNGDAGDDILRGDDGADTLDGGEGNDTLVGGNENDILNGGAGIDTLRGQAGNDTFEFAAASDSAFGAADLIDGIDGVGVSGGDRIDLSQIDADTTLAGEDAFVFLGEQTTAAGLAAGAGALWLENVGDQTRIYGELDGDGVIDLVIKVNDGAGVVAADYLSSDFVL